MLLLTIVLLLCRTRESNSAGRLVAKTKTWENNPSQAHKLHPIRVELEHKSSGGSNNPLPYVLLPQKKTA